MMVIVWATNNGNLLEPRPMAFTWSWNQNHCVEATVGFAVAVGVDNGLMEEVGLGMMRDFFS